MTIVMIAHRPASLDACGTVIEIRKGRIVSSSSGRVAGRRPIRLD
jgi:ABC-type bacteriocin/lantibiotic exporter with double-glycine peptidase domain